MTRLLHLYTTPYPRGAPPGARGQGAGGKGQGAGGRETEYIWACLANYMCINPLLDIFFFSIGRTCA